MRACDPLHAAEGLALRSVAEEGSHFGARGFDDLDDPLVHFVGRVRVSRLGLPHEEDQGRHASVKDAGGEEELGGARDRQRHTCVKI